MTKQLHEQVSNVRSREDLAHFVGQLRADLAIREQEWENAELSRYLEALEAWVLDLPGYFENRGEPVPEDPSWSLVAMLLLAAKYYE